MNAIIAPERDRSPCSMSFDGDWVDSRFFEFVDKVVQENDIEGRFYHDLDTGGQDAILIFLTDEQREYLIAHKLLTLWSTADMEDVW